MSATFAGRRPPSLRRPQSRAPAGGRGARAAPPPTFAVIGMRPIWPMAALWIWRPSALKSSIIAAAGGDRKRAIAAFAQALEASTQWFERAANNLAIVEGRE